MATANWIDISVFQDPKKFDYQAAKAAGIKGIIIRAGYGKTQDAAATAHIANAKKYGLKWHLYHYWYNMAGEAEWAVQNAKSLGLTSSQFLFLDMEDKSLSANWNEQFALFRKAVGSAFKVGLYCSDSPYKAKFQDSQLVSLKVYRWVASYSYEPANYDMWQMSGAGSGGFGSYTGDVDRDYDKTDALASYSDSQQPVTPPKTDPGAYIKPDDSGSYVQNIILQEGTDSETGIHGIGYSYDNGAHFTVINTIFGRKYRQEDADRIWPFLKGCVSKQIGESVKIDWKSIKDKPDMDHYYTKDEVDQKVANAASGGKVDLSGYLTEVKADSKYATKAELDNVKAKQGVPGEPGKPGKDGESAYEIAVDHGFIGSEDDWLKSLHGKDGTSSSGSGEPGTSIKIDKSNTETVKAPSQYTDGLFYEVKSLKKVLPDEKVTGTYVLLSTKTAKQGDTTYCIQSAETLDSNHHYTWYRSGSSSDDKWSPWELNTVFPKEAE